MQTESALNICIYYCVWLHGFSDSEFFSAH